MSGLRAMKIGRSSADVSRTAGGLDSETEHCAGKRTRLLVLLLLGVLATGGLAVNMTRRKKPDGSSYQETQHGAHQPLPKNSRAINASNAEAVACAETLSPISCESENQAEPPTEEPKPGRRVRMLAFRGMEYQLFLPKKWTDSTSVLHPVVVFLHGAGDGQFSVMNSQSLPRLLAIDQSTCFDRRKCWCLDSSFADVAAKREAPADGTDAFMNEDDNFAPPLADCDFANTFEGIVVMPQGWLPDSPTGWTEEKLSLVESLTRSTMQRFHGDPARVSLTGQSAGGTGAWHFAILRPSLWASVNVICMPADPSVAQRLEGLDVWVVGWTGDGEMGNDDVVKALKKRTAGTVRYTRYVRAPSPPDPAYQDMQNHASYDLIYRDPRLWQWVFAHSSKAAVKEWMRTA